MRGDCCRDDHHWLTAGAQSRGQLWARLQPFAIGNYRPIAVAGERQKWVQVV
jgi:hypothetical protein